MGGYQSAPIESHIGYIHWIEFLQLSLYGLHQVQLCALQENSPVLSDDFNMRKWHFFVLKIKFWFVKIAGHTFGCPWEIKILMGKMGNKNF